MTIGTQVVLKSLAAAVMVMSASQTSAADLVGPSLVAGCWGHTEPERPQPGETFSYETFCFEEPPKVILQSGWTNQVDDGEGIEEVWSYSRQRGRLAVFDPRDKEFVRFDCAEAIVAGKLSLTDCRVGREKTFIYSGTSPTP